VIFTESSMELGLSRSHWVWQLSTHLHQSSQRNHLCNPYAMSFFMLAWNICGSAGTTKGSNKSGDFHGIVSGSRSFVLLFRMKASSAPAWKRLHRNPLYYHCALRTLKTARTICGTAGTTKGKNNSCDFHGIVSGFGHLCSYSEWRHPPHLL